MKTNIIIKGSIISNYNTSIRNFMILVVVSLFTCFEVNAQGTSVPSPVCLPGFTDELISNNWADVRQITFDSLGRMFVVEGAGKIFIIDTNNVQQVTPLIDISEEVGGWGAHGLLGMALDKDFLSNGYFYLMYTVDRHYLLYYGTAQYNSNVNDYFNTTINRITRYQADSSTNFTTLIPGSRQILIGADKKTGIPVIYNNHDGGCIAMSPDGSLLVTTGDGGHGGAIDTGSNSQTYYLQALADTILTPETNVGGYRSQLIQSPNGKMLRFDPMTGLGLPSNPYYDAAHPESFQSMVWSTGLRNPFRFSIRPASAAVNNMAAGQPGALFINSVGFHTWEDFYVANSSGINFGWPLYEGMFIDSPFVTQVENKFAANPLYGTGTCTSQYFRFIDLIINATLDTSPSWPNPCDSMVQVPVSLRSIRTRPILSYHHTQPIAYVPTYVGNDPAEFEVGAPGSPATGPELFGNCIAGNDWYTGSAYPSQFRNKLFYLDFGIGNMVCADIDSNNNLTAIDTFATHLGNPISVVYDKRSESIYYIEYPFEIHRIRYTLGLNIAPKAKVTQDVYYGPGPLTVNFNGLQSTDPENGPLIYSWDFGDGNTSSLVNPQNVYIPPTGNPTEYNGTLTVTDTGGLVGVAQFMVSVNNTPPVVQITSPIDGSTYSNVVQQVWNLTANVSDAEHDSTQLHWSWYSIPHHDLHEHNAVSDTSITSNIITEPEDCIDSYFYEITLTVTDDAGLSGVDTVFIYQDCPLNAKFQSDLLNVCKGDSVHYYQTVVGNPDSLLWIFQKGSPATSTLFNPVVAYQNTAGLKDVTLIAYKSSISDTLFVDNYMSVKNAPVITQNVSGTIVTCVDSSVQISVTDSAIYTYHWRKNGIALPGDTLSSYLAQTSGVYNVLVSQIMNGCSVFSSPLNYIEHAISNSLTLSGSSILCTTDSVVISGDYDPSYSYQWFKNGLMISGAITNNYVAYITGNYHATINDSNTCAVVSNTANIVKIPESDIVFTTDSIICPAGDVVIMDANAGIGLSYQWYRDGTLIAGATLSSYTATVAGQYSVLVSDGNGCSHISNTLEITDCTGIHDYSSNEMFSIYPNPVSNTLHISSKFSGTSFVQIKVVDAVGKLMINKSFLNQPGNDHIELKTNALPQGVYEVLIQSDKFSEVKRFVKN